MTPQDFLLNYYQTVVPYTFQDERLASSETVERLRLNLDDEASLAKFRVSVISMVLTLSQRGVGEAFVERYKAGFSSGSGLVSFMARAQILFDAVVSEHRRKAVLPDYVGENYFQKWRNRYNERILTTEVGPLRPTVLQTFLGQTTFAYQNEPMVEATDVAILAQGEEFYDSYVIGLRKFLGQEILQ